MNIKQSVLFCLFISPSITFAAQPIAQDDNRSVRINRAFTIDVLNNDSDPDGDTISLLANSVSQPNNGNVVVNPDGGIQYTPNLNYVGIDSFTYVVIDDSPAAEQATATVTINIIDRSITSAPAKPNEQSVANALESACQNLSAIDPSTYTSAIYNTLANNCESLLELFLNNPEEALRAVQQIAPEETLSLAKVGSNASDFQAKMIANRLMQLGQDISNLNPLGLSWSSQLGGLSAGENSILAKLGVFASIQLEDAEKKRSDYEAGFDYSANGITVGSDYSFSPSWFAGAALGYTTNDLSYSANGGSVESNIFTFILYNTINLNNFNLDLQAGYGSSNIDISRTIRYGTPGSEFNATTNGQTSGAQNFLRLQAQYAWSHKALTLFPSFLYSIANSQVNQYADNNAGGWEVVISEQNVKHQTIEAAIQGTYAISKNWGVIIPNFDITVISDLDTDQDITYGQFAFAPNATGQFAMYGEPPESLFYVAGLGFSLVLPNGATGFLSASKTLGYLDYSSTRYQAGIRFEF